MVYMAYQEITKRPSKSYNNIVKINIQMTLALLFLGVARGANEVHTPQLTFSNFASADMSVEF